MNVVKHFQSLCTPARVYVAVSLFLIILSLVMKFNLMHALLGLLVVILVTLFLDFLCKNGYKSISWLFVLIFLIIPIILGILGVKTRFYN